MLEETKQFLNKAKHSRVLDDHKRQKRKYYFKKYLKIITYLAITFLIISILFFPIQSATVLGTWYNDFIGTLVSIIKQSDSDD